MNKNINLCLPVGVQNIKSGGYVNPGSLLIFISHNKGMSQGGLIYLPTTEHVWHNIPH